VAPALKLWRSALEQLGGSPEDHPRVFSLDDKYRIRISPYTSVDARLPLREVLFLEWAEPKTADGPQDADAIDAGRDNDPALETSFTRIEGVHAIARLMEFTHHDYLMKPTGRQTGSFLLCSRIMSQARAFAFRRPRDFGHIDRVVDDLERHLATIPA
jgi:hypothetical protein